MVAVVWLVAGIVLAAAEALTGDLSLLMLGVGALITAGIAALSHAAAWSDALVFGVVSVGLLFVLRPMLLRRFAVPLHPTNVDALPGKSALVMQEIRAHTGQVKIDGDVWSARPMVETDTYPVGETVMVIEIDGATAVVWKGPQ